MKSIHKTYTERCYLSRGKHRRLDRALVECARLYNAALEHWQTAYKRGRVSVTYIDQCKEFTGVRASDAYWGAMSVQVGRGVLRRLDRARRRFFNGAGEGAQATGYPKFKSSRRWKTVEIAEPSPSMVANKRDKWAVKVKGLPILLMRPKRSLPSSSRLKAVTITRKPMGVYVGLTYELPAPDPAPRSGLTVGADMGVLSRITLSDGVSIERRVLLDTTELEQRISRCKSDSGTQRKLYAQLARSRARAAVRNRNECHRITTDLIRRYDLIALEDLRIPNMVKSAAGTVEKPGRMVKAKTGLNRSIAEQTWGMLRRQLEYKAEWHGKAVVLVDAAYTSQTCSACGVASSDSRRGKTYTCVDCGNALDADVNAARVILQRAMAGGTPPPSTDRNIR